MFKVYTANEVFEVPTIEEAEEIVDSEWVFDAEPDKSGFINPWIEDENGDGVDYTPTREAVERFLDGD